jgi:hypothetical protein
MRARGVDFPVETLDVHGKQCVGEHVAPREQRRGLEYDADVAPGTGDQRSAHVDFTRGASERAGDQPEQRALAAAARADHRHELAVVNREIDARERVDGIAFDRLVALADRAARYGVARANREPGIVRREVHRHGRAPVQAAAAFIGRRALAGRLHRVSAASR